MKKYPRKFSEGGKAAPASTSTSIPQPKPQEKKNPPPDWVDEARRNQKQDMDTQKGHKYATDPKRLGKYKAGGKVKKFSKGEEVEGRFGKSDPDIYERARASVARKNSEEAGEAGSIREPGESNKPKASKPKAISKTPAKPELKPAPKVTPKAADKPAEKKSEAPAVSPEVNARIKDSLARMEAKAREDAQERYNRSSYSQRRAGGFGGTEPDVPYKDTSPTPSPKSAPRDTTGPVSVNEGLSRLIKDMEARSLARSRVRAGLLADPSQVYKKGGKVAKYAKGGGIEAKGKTKGTVVKMAAGGSVKGWGIARGSKACKMK